MIEDADDQPPDTQTIKALFPQPQKSQSQSFAKPTTPMPGTPGYSGSR